MTKFSDFIRSPGTAGPPTVEGVKALGFLTAAELPPEPTKLLSVGVVQAFTGPEKTLGQTNLGVLIGTNVQGYSAGLASLGALTPAADRVPYATGLNTYALTTLTANGRALIATVDAAAARTALALVIGTDVQAYDAQLATVAALTGAAGSFIRWTGATSAAMQAIVGTVSQSAGVPTGAIIEQGSNANGNYVKYADGTMICWSQQTSGSQMTTAAASLYRTLTNTWTFPVAFAATPVISYSHAGAAFYCWAGLGGAAPSASATSWVCFSFAASAANPVCGLQAIGRWY